MTKRLKIIISVVSAAVTVILTVITSVIILTRDDGIDHFQTDEIGLTLTRNKLTFPVIDENGESVGVTDDRAVDFSDPKNENIFGINKSVKIFPGDKYIAEMEITNSSETEFVYWIEIKLTGDLNELAKQIAVTVSPDGWPKKQARLDEGLTFGSERAPIAKVSENNSSGFTVTVEFIQNSDLNNDAQNLLSAFDLIVYAVPYTG